MTGEYYRRLFGSRPVADDSSSAVVGRLDGLFSRDTGVGSGACIREVPLGYLFSGLPVAPGVVADVELRDLLVGAGGALLLQTPPQWRLSHPGVSVVRPPTGRETFQMLRCLYDRREHPALEGVVASCIAGWRSQHRRYCLSPGTDIAYSGMNGTIAHHDGYHVPRTVEIPVFTPINDWWSYLELAPEQSPGLLGNVCAIPSSAVACLAELFGPGYEMAGAVFQYAIEPMANGNLPQVGFCTPTLKRRKDQPSRTLVLGVDDVGRFNIIADDYTYNVRPARGVAVREVFSSGGGGVLR